MVRALCSIKALLLSAIPIVFLVVSDSCQSHLRPEINRAIRGYEKPDSKALSSIEEQIKKLHHIRNQRQISTESLFKDHGDVWILEGFRNWQGCPKAVHRFKVFENAGDWYAVIATNALENNTEIYHFDKVGCGKLLETLPTRLAFDFEIVRTNDVRGLSVINIVVLENSFLTYPHKRVGSTVYTILFENTNVRVSRREVLRSEKPTCVTTWEQFGVPHVAICNSNAKDFRGTESYRTKSYIYCASGGYFDRCGEIDTHFPQAIQHFRIFSKHYIAVANHPNETEAKDVPTEILRYELGSKSYQHLQFLPTKGAKDLCFLNIGSDLNSIQFLIVVNHLTFDSSGKVSRGVTPHVYQFIGEKFEPFQTIPLTSKTTACAAYEAENGKAAIIFSTPWGVDVYQYDGWRFRSVFQYSNFALGAGISHLAVVTMGEQTFITAANSNPQHSDSDNLFSPVFSRRMNDTLTSVYSKSISSCHRMRKELEVDPIRRIVDLHSQAVKKNDTIIRLGKVDFKLLSTEQILTTEVVNIENKTRLGLTQVFQLQNITAKLDELGHKLQASAQRFKLAIRTNGNYVIHGRVHVNTLLSTCRDQNCLLQNLTAKTINSVEISDTFEKSVLLKGKSFPSLKIKRLIVQRQINTTVLSNRNIDDYIQMDKDNNFHGKFRIDGNLLVNGHLNVKGLIDDRVISSDVLLLRQGNQNLNWTLKASYARLKDMKAHLINDKDIRHLYQHAISSTANFTLLQPKFFSSLTVTNLSLSGLINKVNLTGLINTSMKLSGDQVVSGIHGYNAANLGHVILRGTVNGKQFPKDFISVRENDKLKLNKLRLDRTTAVAHLTITENIAGMQVKGGRWGTNLLNKSSNLVQMVTGRKNFEYLGTSKNVLSSTLNKLPMDTFNTDSVLYGHPDELLVYDSVDVNGDVTFEKPLSVTDTEGIGLHLLEEIGVLLSTENFPPIRSLTLTNNVKITSDLSTVTLDGVPSVGFLTRNKKVPIVCNGRKTFSKTVSMNHTFSLLYTLNGYDLKDLWNESLKIDGDQTFSGSLQIQNNVDVVKLQASYSQLVSLATPGMLTGTKNFQNLAVRGNWFVDELHVKGLVNDVDVSSWPSDTVLKNRKHQTVRSQKSILSLTVRDAEVVAIDEMDIKHLLDVVMTNQPIIIHSDLLVSGPFFSNKITINGSIDDVPSDAPLNWLRYKVDQNLSGALEVRGSLDVKDFRQHSWTVNKVDLHRILEEAVRTNDTWHFSSLQFRHIILDNLNLGGLIQGHNITEDLILKDKDQLHRSLTGVKSFSGPLVSESFHVTNELNGIDPREVCQTPIPPQNSKWVVFGNVLIQPNIKMNVSLINRRNLTELTQHLWLKEADVRVQPKQNFSHVTLNGAFSEKLISNVNLSDLNQRSVKLASVIEQQITAFHRFQSVQTNGILAVESLNSSRINEVDVKYLTSSVLLRDTNQSISNHITFQDVVASNIVINGVLNGVDVNTSLMRNDQLNVITGQKLITSLQVTGAVETCDTCLVGAFDISNWASRAVLRKGNFTLSGAQFESLVFQQPLGLNGSLNNVTVTRDHLLTLSDQQEIDGLLSVSSLLPDNIVYLSEKGPIYQQTTEEFNVAARFKNLQVNGLYDGVFLPHFYEKLVRRDRDMVFSEPVVVSRLIVNSLKDSSTNSTIRDIIELPLNAPHHLAGVTFVPEASSIENTSISTLIKEIDRVISRQSIELKFFEETSVSQKLPPVVDALFAWETRDGQIELCSFVDEDGELFYGSSTFPLLTNIHVTGVSSLKETEDFAVAALDRSEAQKHDSFIFSQISPEIMAKQIIPTNFPIDATAFFLHNQTCYLFLEKTSKSPIYCRPLGVNGTYTLTQHLPTVDARLVTISHHHSTRLPLLVISSVAQRGHGHITVWNFNITSRTFEPWKKIITLQIVAMDSICSENQCLLATVAPSKPAAIPGQVIIWSLNDDGPPKRLQRLAFTEPIDVKFTRLPDGRVALLILQSSGVDNVSVYIWRGLMQFQPETTVRVPGAQDLQLVSNNSQLILALTVASSVPEVPYGPVRMFRAHFLGQFN